MSPHANSIVLIPELMSLVFSHLDQRSVARTATVSVLWAEMALDSVWRNVDDIRRLLFLLAPLVAEKQSGSHLLPGHIFRFKKGATLNWQSFDRYAPRVRRLQHDEAKRKFIDSSVWDDMVKAKRAGHFLPNLQTLVWHAMSAENQYGSLLFAHSKVQRISIQLHRSSLTLPYMITLSTLVKELVDLELKSDAAMRDVEPYVLPLLRCSTLQRIRAPIFFYTSSIFRQLSLCTSLRMILFSKPAEQGIGDRADVAIFSPDLPESAFPVLEQLSFSAHILHAAHFIRSAFSPKNISFLYVNVAALDGPLAVRNLFSTVADTCKALVEFHIDFVVCPYAPIVSPPPPLTDRPSINTFQPLLSCKCLTKFEFRWDYQLNLTQDDMEELASSWPRLEVLLLHCQPIPEHTPSALTLEALIPFAQHCPRLRELGLYIDARNVPPPLAHYTPAQVRSIPSFRSLKKLSVGASSIGSVEPVVLFLSQLCPLGCEIVSGVRWPDAFGIALDQIGILDNRRLNMTEWWVRWTDVGKALPLATKARLEERERVVGWLKERMGGVVGMGGGVGAAVGDRAVNQLQAQMKDLQAFISG